MDAIQLNVQKICKKPSDFEVSASLNFTLQLLVPAYLTVLWNPVLSTVYVWGTLSDIHKNIGVNFGVNLNNMVKLAA